MNCGFWGVGFQVKFHRFWLMTGGVILGVFRLDSGSGFLIIVSKTISNMSRWILRIFLLEMSFRCPDFPFRYEFQLGETDLPENQISAPSALLPTIISGVHI